MYSSTACISALKARKDIDEDTAVAVQISRALAVTATAVAGEGDGLPSECAAPQGAWEEIDIGRRADVAVTPGICEKSARGHKNEGNDGVEHHE